MKLGPRKQRRRITINTIRALYATVRGLVTMTEGPPLFFEWKTTNPGGVRAGRNSWSTANKREAAAFLLGVAAAADVRDRQDRPERWSASGEELGQLPEGTTLSEELIFKGDRCECGARCRADGSFTCADPKPAVEVELSENDKVRREHGFERRAIESAGEAKAAGYINWRDFPESQEVDDR